jgi:hypothetical protein
VPPARAPRTRGAASEACLLLPSCQLLKPRPWLQLLLLLLPDCAQAGGKVLDVPAVEITYGLERILMSLQVHALAVVGFYLVHRLCLLLHIAGCRASLSRCTPFQRKACHTV